MNNLKGGPGSGRKPSGSNERIIVRDKPVRIGPKQPARAGQRPGSLYPRGRNPDGTPVQINDVRNPAQQPQSPKKPKKQ